MNRSVVRSRSHERKTPVIEAIHVSSDAGVVKLKIRCRNLLMELNASNGLLMELEHLIRGRGEVEIEPNEPSIITTKNDMIPCSMDVNRR